MSFETGESVRVISEAGTHTARVLLGGEDRITVDVPGWGVQVFRRAGDRWEPAGRCEVPGCDGDYEELGHLTYERLGAELESDVQAQCKAHNRGEREARIARRVLGD